MKSYKKKKRKKKNLKMMNVCGTEFKSMPSCVFLYQTKYHSNHITSFGLFIEMQPAISPIILIHLSFSFRSPSLVKIYTH